MSTITPSNALAATILEAFKAAIDAGGAAGKIEIYTGTKPASPDTAIGAQVLLGTLPLSYPCGTVSSRTLTFSTITQDSSADDTGTATWARIKTSAGVAVVDVDASTVGGAGFLQMNTTSIVKFGPILINSMTITA